MENMHLMINRTRQKIVNKQRTKKKSVWVGLIPRRPRHFNAVSQNDPGDRLSLTPSRRRCSIRNGNPTLLPTAARRKKAGLFAAIWPSFVWAIPGAATAH